MFIGKSRLRRFFGHQLRFRRQKAWFLPAAQQGETQVRQVPMHRDILGSTGIGVRPIT